MKIAQVAPLCESVPPKFYGGTERIVSYLTEELVRQGYEVTLFSSGDSVTRAKLRSPVKKSLRHDNSCIDSNAPHFVMMEEVAKRAQDFDIIHYHIDYLHFPISRRENYVHLTTLHGRLDIQELKPIFNEYSEMPVVSISFAQRKPLQHANWVGNVYHGIPSTLYQLHDSSGKYLAFLGRISPEKRVDRAIQIALGAGMPIKIAAKVDKVDLQYYQSIIKPMLKHPLIEFIGEIGEREKDDFLGNALALIFPIDWPEPFGLVMIEAMACGTPVIAFPNGSVPEVIDDKLTGYLITDIQQGIKAVETVSNLSRKKIREIFEKRFTVERMADNYISIYKEILSNLIMDVA
jgi:glycosyltransferase involved in cell wall biosynthesis